MNFGSVAPTEAEGCLLAHATKLPGKTFKKGHVLSAADCIAFSEAGFETIVVARLETGDLNEDVAATRLAHAAMDQGLTTDTAFTGRMNLYADNNGVLILNEDAISAANRIDPAITFATLPNFETVSSGRMIATAKIIPFAVPEVLVARAEAAIKNTVGIAGFSPMKIGLVATELPHLKSRTMDKTRRVLEDRLRLSNSIVLQEKRVPHTQGAVATAIHELLQDDVDLLVLFGASAVVDRKDVLPAALEKAGGRVRHLGMPVDPGNLLMLGEIKDLPVLGAPGCARSPKENGFDWVLDRLLAGLDVSPEDITGMGVGGLLMEIGTRPQPRETKKTATAPKIAAIILGAGKSSRMGGPNKLLAKLGGKALVRYAAEAAVDAGLQQNILVTGHLADQVGAQVLDLDIAAVHNPDFADGMAGSIRTGMNALRPDIDAVLILLADMPGIDGKVIESMVAAYRKNATNLIVTATAAGKRGNPVLWDRRFFDGLKNLTGDIGARHLIAENPGFVTEVEIGSAARLDLDTPETLRAAGGSLPQNERES